MKPLTILIVDDEPLNLQLLRGQLESEERTVLEAGNGAEAWLVLNRQPVDVIVSDILMPVMDGYRLCHEVRASDRHRNLPFIIYTSSYVSPSDEKLSLEFGADKYLRKPAPAGDILRAIEEALSGPRRQPSAALDVADVLELYNARLVAKLEKKNIELTAAVERLTLQTTALETAADAILITDAQGVILWINQSFTRMTGFTAGEAIGKTPRILKSGRHDEGFYREFWRTIQSGETWRSEFANRRKDGTICYDEHTITPVRGGDGTITHFVGVLHDITERKRAEDELREAHEKLRDILDHSPAVLYALKVDGTTIIPRLVSKNITRLLGFEVPETASSQWWEEQLHPEDRVRAEASLAETLAQGVSRTEYRMRHKNGTYRWVDDNRRLARDLEGAVELVGVWTDITDRKLAQEGLQESERRSGEMLDNLDLVALMVDRDARITYCNDYFLRLTGWQREEVLGRDFFQLFIPPEQLRNLREIFASLIGQRPEAWHHTNEILTRSGQRRLLHWNNTLLRSPTGEVLGTASIAADITDQRNLEKQMLRAQRLESLGTLASGIAHDLNNLFMPILMGVTLLRRFEPDERSLKAIDNIESSVKRGRDLVKQVLLFARGGETSREAIALAPIAGELEAIMKSTFPKNIVLNVAIPSDLSPVSGDATQLAQVLLNLCVNARDAMPQGGRLSISAANTTIDDDYARMYGGRSGGPYVILEVTDTGEGMPREVIDRIFDPFFTTKEVGKGTGLGLSTVQGIVTSHGGFLTVASGVGEGSSFKVHLPAAVTQPLTSVPDELTAPPQGHGELILVVDDEASALSITTQALEASGYQVVTAEDGAKAIGVFSRSHSTIALVLTDVAMPVMDGPALIAALKQIDPEVPVIVTTGSASAAYMTRIAGAGVACILAKPYTADQLLRAVADAVRGTRGNM